MVKEVSLVKQGLYLFEAVDMHLTVTWSLELQKDYF
jgi:hypothetical protein